MAQQQGVVGGGAQRGSEPAAAHTDPLEVIDVMCECGRRDCTASVRLSFPTLSWARSRGLTVLSPGHEGRDDFVAERTDQFLFVRHRHG